MKSTFKLSNLKPDAPKSYKPLMPKSSSTHKRTHSLHFDVKNSILKKSSGTPESHYRTMSSNKSATPEIDQPSKYSNTESDSADREVSAIWDFINQRCNPTTKANLSELRENIEPIIVKKLAMTTKHNEQRIKAKRMLLDRFNSCRREGSDTSRPSDEDKRGGLDSSRRVGFICQGNKENSGKSRK